MKPVEEVIDRFCPLDRRTDVPFPVVYSALEGVEAKVEAASVRHTQGIAERPIVFIKPTTFMSSEAQQPFHRDVKALCHRLQLVIQGVVKTFALLFRGSFSRRMERRPGIFRLRTIRVIDEGVVLSIGRTSLGYESICGQHDGAIGRTRRLPFARTPPTTPLRCIACGHPGLSGPNRGGGCADRGRELPGHGGFRAISQPLAHPGPTVGADVPDGLGQRTAGVNHLTDGLGLGGSGGGLAQAGDGGGFIDQAVGEGLAEGLRVKVGSGIPGGQRPGESSGLGVGRQLELSDQALVPGAGVRVAQQKMGPTGGLWPAHRVRPPGRAAGGPAAMRVAQSDDWPPVARQKPDPKPRPNDGTSRTES